jgi:hypothetical protein
MPCDPEKMKKLDAMMDAFLSRRKSDAFEEAHHPRNAGGTFTVGEGKEPEEKGDTQMDPGLLSKRNVETT